MVVGAGSSLLAGRYRVDRQLGRGGMAAVYLAHDEKLDRRVAVKRLHTDSPEDAARRFAREAKLGASLNHPNLVWVFDAVADHEGVLIIMEYVEGTTLARELQGGPLRPRRAAEVIQGVARALDHAHEHGIVHRDVKPANMLLGKRGAIKLADLGIATAAEHTRITRSDVVLGTAAYLAPEQLDGHRPSPATDIYSLATVAFEALTGVKARRGRTPVEIAHAIANTPPPDLREEWQQAPAAAAEVLKCGMSRDRVDRPETACELADQLAKALEGEDRAPSRPRAAAPPPPPPKPPAPPPSRAQPVRRARRRVSPLLPMALLAAALLVAGVVALSAGGGGDEKSSSPTKQPAPKKQKKTKNESSNPSAGGSTSSQTTAPSAAPPAPPPPQTSSTPANGASLNNQGFRLMKQGRYAEAVPILRKAVAAFPSGTTDLNYAYALFNLGRALRVSGHPAEAIPILERRLRIPDQTETVKRELELARRAAGR